MGQGSGFRVQGPRFEVQITFWAGLSTQQMHSYSNDMCEVQHNGHG